MAGFPPAKGNQKPSKPAQIVDLGPVSTGNGGIKMSLRVKAAGTKNAPGLPKDVNTF